MSRQDSPVVTIVCITYNHAPYIRQCLDGFVMQKTDFPIEVLIHDDASTDGTEEIVREYSKKHPELFFPFYEKQNQFGRYDFCRDLLYPRVRGKFVALCEGDDYWTDPLKLQKQVNYLESRPDATICFHPVTVHWEDDSKEDSEFPSKKSRFKKTELMLSYLLKTNFIPTNSVLYRWRFHEDSLSLIPDRILPGDWFLHLLHAQKGKILFYPDNMAVYRKHKNGIWWGCGKEKSWYKKNVVLLLNFYKEVERAFDYDCTSSKVRLMTACYAYAIRDNETEWLSELKHLYPLEIPNARFPIWRRPLLKIVSFFVWGRIKEQIKLEISLIKIWRRILS